MRIEYESESKLIGGNIEALLILEPFTFIESNSKINYMNSS